MLSPAEWGVMRRESVGRGPEHGTPNKKVRRGLTLQLFSDAGGDGEGEHFFVAHFAADAGHFSEGEVLAFEDEIDFVVEGFFADSGHAEGEFDFIFEAEGGEKFARG